MQKHRKWMVLGTLLLTFLASLLLYSCGKLDGFAVGELVSISGDVQ